MTNSLLSSLFLQIIPSIIFYRTININLQKWRSNSPTENIRIISSIHAIITTVLSSAYLAGKLSLTTYSPCISLASYGYFLMDLSHILLYKNQYSKSLLASYLVHHSLAIVGISYIDLYPYYIARGYLAELSTPFVNMSWYLSRNGKKEISYIINGCVVVLLFGVVRVINLAELLYNRPEGSPFIYTLTCSSLLCLNGIWMRGLANIYYKDYSNYKLLKKNN